MTNIDWHGLPCKILYPARFSILHGVHSETGSSIQAQDRIMLLYQTTSQRALCCLLSMACIRMLFLGCSVMTCRSSPERGQHAQFHCVPLLTASPQEAIGASLDFFTPMRVTYRSAMNDTVHWEQGSPLALEECSSDWTKCAWSTGHSPANCDKGPTSCPF